MRNLNLVKILQPILTWILWVELDSSAWFWFYLILFWSNITSTSTFSFDFMIYLRFLLSWENNWKTIRAWKSFCHLNSQSRNFYWCWLNRLLVLLYLVHSDWFILIYLIDFVDFHWYFEAGRLTVSCQSGGVCCIYTVKLAVCTVWLTLAQPPF